MELKCPECKKQLNLSLLSQEMKCSSCNSSLRLIADKKLPLGQLGPSQLRRTGKSYFFWVALFLVMAMFVRVFEHSESGVPEIFQTLLIHWGPLILLAVIFYFFLRQIRSRPK